MLRAKSIICLVSGTLFSTALIASTHAGDRFESDGTTYYLQTVDPFPLPNGELLLWARWTGTHVANDITYPSHMSAQDCVAMVRIASNGESNTTQGSCVLTDPSGDQEMLDFVGDQSGGTFTITGGSGKYNGATGSGTYQPPTSIGDNRGVMNWHAKIELAN